jgi:acyl carrier protein
MRAKVAGSWNLHRLSMSMKLDCFILYSSLAALFGAAGQSNYAAANGFMDHLARHRRRLGLPALSVNWGAWSGAGMAQRQGAGSADGAILPLTPDLALAGLDAALGSRRPQLAVARIDRAAFARRMTDETPPLVADWLGGVAPQAAAQPALATAVLAAPQSSQTGIVQKELINCARAIMSLADGAGIDENKIFLDMGFDSLMSVELKFELEKKYNIRVPSTLVFDYPNITTLSNFVLKIIRERWGQGNLTSPVNSAPELHKVSELDPTMLDLMKIEELAELLEQLL